MRDRSLPKQIDPYVDPDQQHLSPGMGNFVFSLTPFALIYPIFTCVDPDPYSEYESSRSTKMLNTDPSWIRIYNAVKISLCKERVQDPCGHGVAGVVRVCPRIGPRRQTSKN